MSGTGIVLNYEDYAALPADGRRYELHEGELSVTPAPTPRHQMISANLFKILHVHVDTRALGLILYSPVDVILNPPDATSIVQPDLVYLDHARPGAAHIGLDRPLGSQWKSVKSVGEPPAGRNSGPP